MMSWEEYIKSNILEFRKRYKTLPEKEKKLVEKDERVFLYSLNKPCQVVVIDLTKPYPNFFIILHSEKYPDMEATVLENVVFEDFSSNVLKKVKLLDSLSFKEIREIARAITIDAPTFIREGLKQTFQLFNKGALASFRIDPRFSSRPYYFSESLHHLIKFQIGRTFREEQRKKIEETVGDIKRDARAISETEVRTKVLGATERLEAQITQLHKKVDEEVSKMRQLIGTSERFLDWKVFTGDFEYLKTTHIPKDVFDAHIKRLDEKINKGLEAINTRIEDLKAIKFWSKRTVLEIALVIWGTIVTLYASGILRF